MKPTCTVTDHTGQAQLRIVDEGTLDRCARIFRAMGDPGRLRLLAVLAGGPACVGDLLLLKEDTMAVVSQRLRVLRAENIVRRKRQGKHVIYMLADEHTLLLVSNGLDHAAEHFLHPESSTSERPFRTTHKENIMPQEHITHANHSHEHGEDCGHTAIQHDGHTDFLHDGHLHHPHEGHIDEHVIEVSAANPADCTDGHPCNGHDAQHTHGPDCGHEAVPHGDHTDYLVEGHLHHPHHGHCDNHGNLDVVQ